VCLGSAAFTMGSFAFTTATGDSGRVAAQIVTGIGFLGGGVILREARGVTGTTTAATIWMTAAIGMVVGSGRAGSGIGLAVLVRVTMVVLSRLESLRIASLPRTLVRLVADPDHGKTRFLIERIVSAFEVLPEGLETAHRDDR